MEENCSENAVVHENIGEKDLQFINKLTRRELKLDEVYTFSVILCDNEIDRDFERFTPSALAEIATLFVGKTGIFDHNPKGENQTARIYFAEVITDSTKKNSLGEAYIFVKAKAYMVKSDRNSNLILDIDAGIKKEVSVSCSAKSVTCSVCGENKGKCAHKIGKNYDGKICHYLLGEIADAYEWSFVAIPAQINAGVTKSFLKGSEKMRDVDEIIKAFGEGGLATKAEVKALCEYIDELKQEAFLGKAYKEDLQRDVTRLAFLAENDISEVFENVTKKMNIPELKAFKENFEKKLDIGKNLQIQLKPSGNCENADEFKM